MVELTHKITYHCLVCRRCFKIVIGLLGVLLLLEPVLKFILSLRFCPFHERWISLSLSLPSSSSTLTPNLSCQSQLRFSFFLVIYKPTLETVKLVYFLSLLSVCHYLLPFFRFICISFKSLKLDFYLIDFQLLSFSNIII